MDPIVKILAHAHNRDYASLREVVMEELTIRAGSLLEHIRPLIAEKMSMADQDNGQSSKTVAHLVVRHPLPDGTSDPDGKLPAARAGKRKADQ